MADVQDIYRGIISPNGGMYQPGPAVQFPSQSPNDALAQLLIMDATGGAGLGTGMRGSGEVDMRQRERVPNSVPGPSPVAKFGDRLPVEPAGYGPDFGEPSPVTTAVPKSKFAFTGSDPFDAYTRDYVASARPASLMSRQPLQQGSGGGLFGISVSPGMNRNLAGRAGIAGIPGLPPRVQIAAQNAALAQALVEGSQPSQGNPGITYNDYRYTPGEAYTQAGNDMAFMPTSVQSSSRWQTGY
jgi:hypothetical protein